MAIEVRITRDGESSALEEAWRLRTCADAGVPVPEVVTVESIQTAEGALDAMVLSKLPGTPLLELLGSLSMADQANAWRKMGVVLRKIHSVPTGGFYKRSPDGEWDFPAGAATAQVGLKERMAEKPFLLAAGFDETAVAFMFSMMRYYNREFNCPDPVLCHGGFLPEHVFFDESMEVTGVIDFGWYEDAHPIRDLLNAWIDFGELEVALLREGYGCSRTLADRFELRLHLALVPFLVGVVAYEERTGKRSSRRPAEWRLSAGISVDTARGTTCRESAWPGGTSCAASPAPGRLG